MKLTVDRIEENIAICENEEGKMIEINISEFTENPKDGDIVELNQDDKYEILKKETENKKEEIKSRFSKLIR